MKKGFTLIEIMVSISVFTFVVAIVSGLFIYAVRIQRSVLAQQELLDQTSYMMEYMSRGLRMAVKDMVGSCLTDYPADTANYQITHAGQGVKFLSPLADAPGEECREFFFDDVSKTLREQNETTGTLNDITSLNTMEVLDFRVVVAGETEADNLQPRVTVLMEIRRRGPRAEDQPSIRLQTTVSQRNLDLP